MGENSKIEWTDHTFNPWIGCQKVSLACDFCYAEAMMDHRYHRVEWGPHGERKRTSEENWRQPLRWAKHARAMGARHRVFCASLADVFDNRAPQGAREDLLKLIEATPELDWLLLTKRPENISKQVPQKWIPLFTRNVWLGTTCETQGWYDRRWPTLRKTPAAVHFISYEPALGPLTHLGPDGARPDWIICGGESGRNARPMMLQWARNIQANCERNGVAFFMKQMGQGRMIPPELMTRQFPVSGGC
jgi:protein gp37